MIPVTIQSLPSRVWFRLSVLLWAAVALAQTPPVPTGFPGEALRDESGRPSAQEPRRPYPGRRLASPFALEERQKGPGLAFELEQTRSVYRNATPAAKGVLKNAHEADLVLAAPGFELPAGEVVLDHPSGLATDGNSLAVADRWHNRVLYWFRAPASNTPPDRVFGQPDPRHVDAGGGRGHLASPASVALSPDGRLVVVADTRNDRVLLWNGIPDRDGAPADVLLDLPQVTRKISPEPPPRLPKGLPPIGSDERPSLGPSPGLPRFGPSAPLRWPWGVWTDGQRLAVVATHGASVLIWDRIPTADNAAPNLVLVTPGVRSPRAVTSDGRGWFAIADVDPVGDNRMRTLVWRSFPTNRHQMPDFEMPGWLKGTFLGDGRLLLAGSHDLRLWDRLPTAPNSAPSLHLRPPTQSAWLGPDAVVAGGRLYATSTSRQQVLAWNSIPSSSDSTPDFALGSKTVDEDVWSASGRIHNPLLASDGIRLFAASARDRKILIWDRLPDETGARPDRVIHLPDSLNDICAHDGRLAVSTADAVYFWERPPVHTGKPDRILPGAFGGTGPTELSGVAMDAERFYVSDRKVGVVHVWSGVPRPSQEPMFSLLMLEPGRLTSDGRHLLAASSGEEPPHLWRLADLQADSESEMVGSPVRLRFASQVLMAEGRLMVANRMAGQVDIWNRVEDAVSGLPSDVQVGARSEQDRAPLPLRRELVHPASIAWAGGFLWVGESRFASRILRFRPDSPSSQP